MPGQFRTAAGPQFLHSSADQSSSERLHVITLLSAARITIPPFNPLEIRGNYSTKSSKMKLVHWQLMGGLLHLVQRGGAWAGCGPDQSTPRCTKRNSPPINGQCTNYRIAE